MEIKANAIFEGGGVRGIAYVGALNYLDKLGYKWQKVAGCSVGSLVATLLCIGYTPKELKDILVNTDFEKFLDKNGIQNIPLVGKALSIYMESALYSGDYLETWIDELLSKKGVKCFRDISTSDHSPLKIIASDITRKKMLILPDDIIDYGINPMKFKISKAIRMSVCIPFYFKPVKLYNNKTSCYILDGSLCCNYPITLFDNDDPQVETVGFKFKNTNSSLTALGKTDPLSILMDIADTMNSKREEDLLCDRNKDRSIIIPTMGVEMTDFNISKEKSAALYKSGYRSAMEFMKNWNYENYREKYSCETLDNNN